VVDARVAASPDLCLVTADVALAVAAEQAGVERVLVDLETLGKSERQAGLSLFLSTHTLDDVKRLRDRLCDARLMVRTNPVHAGIGSELDEILAAGADIVMLAMARSVSDVARFADLVAGRAAISILVEHVDALDSLGEIVRVEGVDEIHVGLNDLRLSLGLTVPFEPLATGLVDEAGRLAHEAGVRFGFGGVTSPTITGLPVSPARIIGEHVRLQSRMAWLGRSFRERVSGRPAAIVAEVAAIRQCARSWHEAAPDELAANQAEVVREVETWRRRVFSGRAANGGLTDARPSAAAGAGA
jgi:hypothetical protein